MAEVFRFPHHDNEPVLLEYLEDLIKDQLHHGSHHLLDLRVQTCQRRVENYPALRDRLLQAENRQKVEQIVDEQQGLDSAYRDGGMLNLSSDEYLAMYQESKLVEVLAERERTLNVALELAKHRVQDKSVLNTQMGATAKMVG